MDEIRLNLTSDDPVKLQTVTDTSEKISPVPAAVAYGGKDGANGLSAYEVAVKNGYKGTEAEWLESLKGGVDLTPYALKSEVPSFASLAQLENYVGENFVPVAQYQSDLGQASEMLQQIGGAVSQMSANMPQLGGIDYNQTNDAWSSSVDGYTSTAALADLLDIFTRDIKNTYITRADALTLINAQIEEVANGSY